jgi:predicted peroxiredoxin
MTIPGYFSLHLVLPKNRNPMKKRVLLAFGIALVILSCNRAPETANSTLHQLEIASMTSDSLRDGIFIHITQGYSDPHRVLMPLKMAGMMAEDKDVLVYLEIHAVELVLKTSKDLEFADFEPLKKMLQDLINRKVGIYACPTCLKIAGHTPEDLMDGIQVASKDRFFDFTDGRIITLDY